MTTIEDVIARFFGPENDISLDALPVDSRDVINPWIERLRQPTSGAVAFLPRRRDGRLWWYAFSDDARARRELLGLLDAWIGATASDLPTSRGRVNVTDPLDSWLAKEFDSRLLRFEVLPATGNQHRVSSERVRRSLQMLDRMLGTRPPSVLRAPRPLGEILDDIGHALVANDEDLSWALFDELRATGSLDEANLAFQRLRILGGLSAWREVLTDPSLQDILQMHRPPGVSRVLQVSFYNVFLRLLDEQERDTELVQAFEGAISGLEGIQLGSPVPFSRGEVVFQYIVALASPRGVQANWLDRLDSLADEVELGLALRLERLRRTIQAGAVVERKDPFNEAQELYWTGDALGAYELAVALPLEERALRLTILAAADVALPELAKLALNRLNEADAALRSALENSAPLSAALNQLRAIASDEAPTDWEDWFHRLTGNGKEEEAVSWAQEGAGQWRPLKAEALTRLIASSSDETLTVVGRIAGLLLEAHREVLRGIDLQGIAGQLLQAMALSGRTSPGVRAQTLTLLDALLAEGPDAGTARDAIESIALITETMVSSATVDWLIDVLQAVTYYPIPSEVDSTRTTFFFEAVEHVRRYGTSLDFVQHESLQNCSRALGIALPDDILALRQEIADESQQYECLSGRRLVIYSLMESASRRAAETLRGLVPGIDIELVAEHDGSDRLAELSRNADVFVVVAAAAKHAATEFIESERNGPIVWVNSKGTSALLREVGRYCAEHQSA